MSSTAITRVSPKGSVKRVSMNLMIIDSVSARNIVDDASGCQAKSNKILRRAVCNIPKYSNFEMLTSILSLARNTVDDASCKR